MNVTTGERTEALTELLREYAEKLTELNREFIDILTGGHALVIAQPGRAAWLLDRAKRYGPPMRELVNQAVRTLEVSELDGPFETEVTLRSGEAEAELHHMLRQAGELQKRIDDWKITESIARLRESAGLNAMKGGPLRPNS